MPILTEDKISHFCLGLEKQSKHPNTIRIYRNALLDLYAFLPEGKEITSEALEEWKSELLSSDYSNSTVHLRITAVNQFLSTQDALSLQLVQVKPDREGESELTREEYRRLLQTAKLLGKDRTYFLIKVFACVGLSAKDISLVTVQTLNIGRIPVYDRDNERGLYIPYSLRQELLEYANINGIRKGPVFLTSSGKPIRREQIHFEIKAIAKDAAVEEDKVNIRGLQKLCADTQKRIRDEVMILIENRYDQLLEAEQSVYGWKTI